MTDYTDDTKTFSVALRTASTPAHGTFTPGSVSYPSTATAGHQITVSCKVNNTGNQTGSFRVGLTGGGQMMRTSSFTVGGGATSPTKSFNVITPSTGSSVTYTLKCIRVV